ncbi:MAG: ATP-binding protein [Candidatus Thiodiazotropha lotti]|uniref:histidine kinase n=1 Tax=Candidatus Thiodiazotropha lotti TaxID=2792787 RepID=A0A9E4N0E7_9GAMM|nr:ATP-binding protein [Candidatus Thiodiazotropha lotti]ODC00112.1 two-component sensor histidine kinase [Candidatus Thiodiazotropha endoloripes]MCG7922247.1 ATP-binding protein [Candidatus Thiodiazotropha lotti]MCG7939108.1 ATP-binding protein [Candidatus Thiodiazotropha lotti]MCG8003716.1 ATP-binding protein [Candidatus Thiodiazotropha lotti]
MRLWPDTLAGRTLALLVGATLLMMISSAILVQDERKARFDEHNLFRTLQRVATLTRLLSDADDQERSRIIQRVTEEGEQISLEETPWVSHPPRHPMEKKIARHIGRTTGIRDHSAIRVRVDFDGRDKHHRGEDQLRFRAGKGLKTINISILLWDDLWINFRTIDFKDAPPWANATLQGLLILLALLVVIGLLIARRMARPMAQLADAAERFGLGQPQSPIPEEGPREVRQTIHAFNLMQQRLQKQISDRSRMLAAVSHDLRTPITTLRLRAEYIDDQEMREKTLATLTEMEAILSDTLSFARDEAADEQARTTDLAALLQSLIDDHADLGGDANYQGPERFNFICRPVSLRRALNNLIDNALKYGETVVASLTTRPDRVTIHIDDNGPGIPDDQLEAVLTPFFRLEASRSRETGGTGLGLAVANSIILAHGGELTLANRPEGGLRVTLALNLSEKQHNK